MAYHQFKGEDGEAFGSFEVFRGSFCLADRHESPCAPGCAGCRADCAASDIREGWYWWACFPGCLPDGEPNGPFASEADAIRDAQENA